MNKLAVLYFVLPGAFIGALASVINKSLYNKGCNVNVAIVPLMFGAFVATAVSQFLVYNGLPQLPKQFWVPFIITAVLNIGIHYWRQKAQSLGEISTVEPIYAVSPIFTIIIAWTLLHEAVSIGEMSGIMLIVIGIYLIGSLQVNGHKKNILKPWQSLISSKGTRYALVASIAAAFSITAGKPAIIYSSPMFVNSLIFLMVCLFYTVSLKIRETNIFKEIRKNRNYIIFVFTGMILGLAFAIMDFSFYYGAVAPISALKRTEVIWVIFLAGTLLHEKKCIRKKIISGILIIIGTFLISR